MFARFFLISGFIALTLPALAKVANAPPGWTHDTTYSEAGIEVLAKDDKTLSFIAGPTQQPHNGPLDDWIAVVARSIMKDATVLKEIPGIPDPSGEKPIAMHTLIVEKSEATPYDHILFVAKRLSPKQPIQLYRLESKGPIKPGDMALTMVLAISTDIPLVDNLSIKRVLSGIRQEKAKAQAAAEAKAAADKAEAERAAQAEEAAQRDLLAKRRTDPGEGLKASELHGIAYDMGKMEHDMFSGIWREVGVTTWLLLKNGWAYRAPDIAPADFDAVHSRKIEPKRWVEWKNNSKFKSLSFYEPLAKGTRVKLSVKRPRVSGWRGVVTSSTQNLNLYEDGRFDISSFSLTSSDLTSDGSNTAIISKSESKDGSSSSVSGQTSTGTGTVSWQQRKGINPSNMGSYSIDGLTIELKFDDGTVLRKVFAMRGTGNVILGQTNYWE